MYLTESRHYNNNTAMPIVPGVVCNYSNAIVTCINTSIT